MDLNTGLSLLNIFLALIAFVGTMHARSKFYPGKFKELINLIAVTIAFFLVFQVVRLTAALKIIPIEDVLTFALILTLPIAILAVLITRHVISMAKQENESQDGYDRP